MSITNRPPNGGIREPYRWRTNHPIRGGPAPHKGNDYILGCGTQFTPPNGGSFACDDPGGTGSWSGNAYANHACGVQEVFRHLQSCNGSTMVSGGAKGMRGNGGSTGCHLHYEILIDGTAVNPQSVGSQNLCDATVRQTLIAEAQSILHNRAGGGGAVSTPNNPNPGGGTSTTPQPPSTGGGGGTGGTITIYVPGVVTPGNPNPVGSYVIMGPDGNVIEVVPAPGVGGGSTLPPTTEDVVPSTNSTNNPVTGCATDTWTAMVNQSVLQTRREMAMNQRFIAKPDSVMAYSCLIQQTQHVGEYAGIFSESQIWANKQISILNGLTATVAIDMGRASLDGAITNVAEYPYEVFLNENFNHNYLGGLLDTQSIIDDINSDNDGFSQAHSVCGTMSRVWQMAKCMNFTADPAFPTFNELITADPRQYPTGYECDDTGITQNMIDIARGRDVNLDPIDPYLTMLYPTGACHTPIATGITVERQEGADQITTTRRTPDGLCITIGCSYQNTGSGAGRCEIRAP